MLGETTRSDILPFRISVAESDLRELHDRLRRSRWPDDQDAGWARGVPVDYLRDLVDRWLHAFDWRTFERTLSRFPQSTTMIDGQTLHVLRARSPEPQALPLVLLHGWPGSFVEFMQVVGPLSDPRRHGGDPADAFEVVVPSIPGFGFSVPLAGTGWSSGRITSVIVELMRRLGYGRYAAHGSDLGAGVAGGLSALDPDRVVGIHVASDAPTAVTFASFSGDPTGVPTLTDAEHEEVARLKDASAEDTGYLSIQTTRPKTLAYALTDSPVGQLAWIVEKFRSWTDPSRDLPEDAVPPDLLLANVTLYWLTRSGASSAHVLFDGMHAQDWAAPGPAPTGWAVFGARPFVRKLLDPDHAVAHWSEFERGGHFPAMEVPELLVSDIRAFFRELR